MINISKKIKSELFKALKNEQNAFGKGEDLEFLSEIWDLRAMPSEDDRFKDAYGDIFQHTINNDDWDIDYLFIDRLNLLEDNDIFSKFLETIVNPKYRENEDETIKFVLLINSYIEKENYSLSISGYDENNFSIYSIQKKTNDNIPFDLPKNTIPFYVVKTPSGHENRFSSHKEPENKPAFVLVHNDGWNDYGYMTIFALFYYKNDEEKEYIGHTKITDGLTNHTTDIIPENFTLLGDNFCSLGQDYDFYQKLKRLTNRNFESVLYALKDAAFFPDIHDKFDTNGIFNTSLLRNDNAERQLREAKHKIYGFDLTNLYSFKYIFHPLYSDIPVEADFNFSNNNELYNRIYAIIGKNGTGKTQLITTLPREISQKKDDYFIPRPPLFSKVIAVSYSIFDDFEIPKKSSSFNYVYCGLHSLQNNKKELLTPRQQVLRFHNTWKRIKELKRMDEWRNILINFIDEEIVDSFVIFDPEDIGFPPTYTVSLEGFNKIKNNLSSGQNIILYIISEIVANIRLDSLILFDEPETHLHPNAISELINTIYELVYKFESYCIITTHSPLVIQEIFSKNIYVVEKHGNIPSMRKIGIETFGENLTVLTEEVFGNKEIKKQYKSIIDKLITSGKSYSDIINDLKLNEMPISLNARLYIKSKISQ
jgi:ABC-type multidrug transport system ATPase subunit